MGMVGMVAGSFRLYRNGVTIASGTINNPGSTGNFQFTTTTNGGGGGAGVPAGGTTVPASGTIVNSYAKVTSIAGSSLNVSTTSGFAAGDRAVIIQMQGAMTVTSDNSTHGDVTGYGTAGRFEIC